ncbi:MAG: TolC family protein, partial [Spirochaetales bacterium]|nr:TolC family protein [Spirochaetales bacterium]
ADAASRAVIDAPVLGASLVASPRYPDSRSDPTDFGTLLSDFAETDGGAGFNVNLTLTLDVPLTAGAARGYREQLDALSAEAADAQSKLAERSVADRAAALIGRRDALGERLDIQRRIAELDGRKAERAESLAAAGTVSAEDAADARTEHERSLAEVLRIELDLLLAELDLRALAGQDLAAVLSSVPR